jgi:hypothetical protein
METDEEDPQVKRYFLLTALALVAVAPLVSQTFKGAFTLLKPSGYINDPLEVQVDGLALSK